MKMMCLIGLVPGGGRVATLTTAVSVTVAPLAPVAVAAGVTVTEPVGILVLTSPTPLSITRLFTPTVDQLSVALWPFAIVSGLAVKLICMGVTVMVTLAVAFPPGPCTVAV